MKRYNKYISFALLVFWEIVIFYFSHNNGSSSTNMSNFITEFIFGDIIERLDFNIGLYVRKAAHIAEYTVLSFIAYYFTVCFFKKKSILIPFVIVFLTACTDELHQTLISGRSGQITDVFVDLIGFLIATAIVFFIRKTRESCDTL